VLTDTTTINSNNNNIPEKIRREAIMVAGFVLQ
jgi:hypothetical protein